MSIAPRARVLEQLDFRHVNQTFMLQHMDSNHWHKIGGKYLSNREIVMLILELLHEVDTAKASIGTTYDQHMEAMEEEYGEVPEEGEQ